MKNDTHRNSTIPETETNSKLKQEKSTALAFLEMSTGNYFSDLLGPLAVYSAQSGPDRFILEKSGLVLKSKCYLI